MGALGEFKASRVFNIGPDLPGAAEWELVLPEEQRDRLGLFVS